MGDWKLAGVFEHFRHYPGFQRGTARWGDVAPGGAGLGSLHAARVVNRDYRLRQQLDRRHGGARCRGGREGGLRAHQSNSPGAESRRGGATGDWLVFIDADSHPSAELFADVAEQIETGRCLAGGCTIRLAGHYPLGNLVTRLWNAVSRTGRLLAGSFIFCEAAAFRQVGGFSNELFAGEELDLSRRLKQLARAGKRRIVILHRHPLVTSARKMHLYTLREHLRFLVKAVFSHKRILTSRDECHTWYDGRR